MVLTFETLISRSDDDNSFLEFLVRLNHPLHLCVYGREISLVCRDLHNHVF